MKKILNGFFYILKHLLLVVAFVSTLYIIVYMYQRLGKSLTEAIQVFMPYAVIFILFCINLILRQKGVTNSIFYNICCCLVFATICYCGYRAIFDHNMIMNAEMGYNIHFNYYSDIISPMKIMLYGLSVVNVCFMFNFRDKKEVEKKLDNVIEVKRKTKKEQVAN